MSKSKKTWEQPRLRSEQVEETLARPACSFKPPGQGGLPRGVTNNRPIGPAFS